MSTKESNNKKATNKTQKERIAIISGLRTPMARAGGRFNKIQADQLGAILFREMMMRSAIGFDEVDEVIIIHYAMM